MKYAVYLSLILVSILPRAYALDYDLPADGRRLLGENQHYSVTENDRNLQAVARRFNTSAMLLIEANNTIAPVPRPGTALTIPTQLLLPDVPREGIVVNLAELRLYYFPPGGQKVQVYPIGIGQQGLETPLMTTRVGQKIANPSWTPPAGIRKRSLERGVKLPAVVPPGPNNPLGRYAMRLAYGQGEYLIHGTSAPDSVGLRVSSGCIRMNAPDIESLFREVKSGTPVRIINDPVKYALEPDGRAYIEVHRPLAEGADDDTQRLAYRLPAAFEKFQAMTEVNASAVDKALTRRAGYPFEVSSSR